jgi:hypothetical protein
MLELRGGRVELKGPPSWYSECREDGRAEAVEETLDGWLAPPWCIAIAVGGAEISNMFGPYPLCSWWWYW